MGRVGKIARLPHCIRSMLNPKIEDGEPGRKLVEWLNSMRGVREVLDDHFEGRPISEQNLSEWKEHGYQDWLKHQESRALARDFLAEAEELEEEVGDSPFTDGLTETVALALAQLLRAALSETEKGTEQRTAVLEIAREIARLRRGDHQMDRVRVARERWEDEKEEASRRKMEELEAKARGAEIRAEVMCGMLWQEYQKALDEGTLTPERRANLEAVFSQSPKHFPGFVGNIAPEAGNGDSENQIKSG